MSLAVVPVHVLMSWPLLLERLVVTFVAEPPLAVFL